MEDQDNEQVFFGITRVTGALRTVYKKLKGREANEITGQRRKELRKELEAIESTKDVYDFRGSYPVLRDDIGSKDKTK